MFWSARKAPKLRSLDLDSLSLDQLPVLTTNELIQLLGLHNRLRNIQRIVGIDQERFELLYLGPLTRFIELAQLAPASTDYHHTGPGGLVRHTVGMIELALNERRKVELPLKSDPEIQQRERHSWTYAVFAGALLHDIGKLVTLSRFDTGSELYNPYSQQPLADSCDTYKIVFIKSPYALHQRLSATFLQLLPPLGQSFLSNNLTALEQLMGFFNDNPYDWGSIGEIVRLADQASVANDLKLGQSRRFPNAPSSPLQERLITALRQLIRGGELPINRPGAALWVKGEFAYLVSKTGADAMREFMNEHGATDIPRDNLRLFDTLQQFGFVISTPEGRAIWKIQIQLSDGFSQVFTVLKFETRRIFHPNNLPQDLKGVIHESEPVKEDLEEPQTTETVQQATETGISPSEQSRTDAGTKTPVPETANDGTRDTNQPVPQKTDSEDFGPSVVPVFESTTIGAVSQEPCVETGKAFIAWLRKRVSDRSITLNHDLIHILNYKDPEGKTRAVAGVLSPLAFDQFATDYGITKGKPHEIVQNSVHKLKIAIKNGRYHIHSYRLKNSPSAKAVLVFYVFDLDVLIPQTIDYKVNESLVFQPQR